MKADLVLDHGTMSALTAAVVVAIQKVYDVLWGPDPRRFSFQVNSGMDFAGMTLHLLAAAMIIWFIGRQRRVTA